MVRFFGELLFFAAFIAAVSMTITKSNLFKIVRKQFPEGSLLGDLMSCPYCFSHWAAIVTVIVYHPQMTEAPFALNVIAMVFALVTLSAPFSWLIFKSYEVMT